MKIFGRRVVTKKLMKKHFYSVKENYRHFLTLNDFDRFFLSEYEHKFVNVEYMTIYENVGGKQYIRFTKNLPLINGENYKNEKELIGAWTGYKTRVVECQRVYVIG